MPRRNHSRNSIPQNRRNWWSDTPPQEPAFTTSGRPGTVRPALLPMVPTTGRCQTGKMRYGTAAEAEEALRRAIINREILQSPIVEDRWYPQPGDAPCYCNGYHLTSSPRKAK